MRSRLAAVCLLLAACGEAPPTEETVSSTGSRPHVVFVVLDTARADFFSSYGFGRPTTPTVDALAAFGVRFERAFATDFWTLPSHASLFTGLYPSEAGATSETGRLPEEVTTLAESLRAAGYRTRAASCNSWISAERGFAQGFEEFDETWRGRPGSLPEPAAVELASRWIESATTETAPLFVFLNLNTPHLPYDPPPQRARAFVSEPWPGGPLARVAQIAGPWAHFTGQLALDETDFRMMRDLYATEIHLADEQVGAIVAALERAGILDQTLLVVTSDHGENIGERGRIGHALSMYDTTLRVPLVLRWPERLPPGRVDRRLVSLVDLVPTLLDLTGTAAPEERQAMERRSFSRPENPGRSFVIAENDRPVNAVALLRERFPGFDASSIDRPLRAIRTEQHKLIWATGDDFELYDLQRDPTESTNRAALEPEIRDELLTRLRAWMTGIRAAERGEAFESQDAEALEWLRALGYID